MQDGRTALHHARSAEVAKLLLDKGADIEATNGVCVVGCRLCVGASMRVRVKGLGFRV